MIDITSEIEAIQREVGSGQIAAGEGRSVKLRRTYNAPIDDVWDALTNPERIGRWFLPISGDYRLGGTYQFEGNAGGKIVACERPNRLRVTWVYGETVKPEDVSEIEVRLSPAGDEATVFELEHIAIVPDDRWAEYGPGAVGVGWDMGTLGLALHLQGSQTGRSNRLAGSALKDETSRPGAARRGVPLTSPAAPTRRLRIRPSPTPRPSTRRRRADPSGVRGSKSSDAELMQ